MLKRRLASALCCAALLLVSAPSAALAQTQRAAAAERNLTVILPEKRPELKTLFSESTARARAGGALTETNFKRFETARWQDDTQQQQKKKWSKRDTAFVVVIVAAVAAVCIWAIVNPGNDEPVNCFDDPSNTLCT
jgi:hypothetical protein